MNARIASVTSTLVFSTLTLLCTLASAEAASTKTYQVTGPVLEVSPTTLTVQKGKEKWEIERNAGTTQSAGEPKVGDKVTVEYTMTATNVTSKPTKK